MEKTAEFLSAVKRRDEAEARRLLEAEPGLVDARSPEGEPAVLAALVVGAEPIARVLIARGARLDLFTAAAAGELAVILGLLKRTPGLAAGFGPGGWTALHQAAFFGRAEAAALLLDQGAERDAVSKNPTAGTALHIAASRGHVAVARQLLDRGAPASAAAAAGWTPLHLAAAAGHEDVVALLIERGADLAARNAAGETPLAIAQLTHHMKVAGRLRKAGAA